MTKRTSIVALLLLIPAVSGAQQRPSSELGTGFGATILKREGATLTSISAPGLGILGQPTIYATFFSDSTSMVQTELGFEKVSQGGSGFMRVGLALQVGRLFAGPATNSAYIAATGALQFVSGGGSDTEFGVGARLGYRMVVQEHFAARLEAGYRRWFPDSDLNEITIGVGLGAVFHKE